MVLERRMNPKNFKLLVYIFGIILEVTGFGLLFAFDKTIETISAYPMISALTVIFAGYVMAVGMRKL